MSNVPILVICLLFGSGQLLESGDDGRYSRKDYYLPKLDGASFSHSVDLSQLSILTATYL